MLDWAPGVHPLLYHISEIQAKEKLAKSRNVGTASATSRTVALTIVGGIAVDSKISPWMVPVKRIVVWLKRVSGYINGGVCDDSTTRV